MNMNKGLNRAGCLGLPYLIISLLARGGTNGV